MKIVKDCVTTHFWLNQIDAMKALIPLITSQICVPNKTEELNLHAFMNLHCENDEYFGSIMDDSVIIYAKIIQQKLYQ